MRPKLTSNSQWWKAKSISFKSRKKTRIPTLATISEHIGILVDSNQRRKKINKTNPKWKRINKVWVFVDDMISQIQNPKEITKNLLELIDEFS